MKTIRIESLDLVNFKGIGRLHIDFRTDGPTIIEGRNGSGKTTIFDAFTWLLFGKDSQDRKTFDIKTLDKSGNPIPRLPHEVSAVLSVDGRHINLTRRYAEKWTKKRGESEEQFTGNSEERLYNDVPCSVSEWGAKIADICGEQTFKMITSPSCFVSQKPEIQRAMLIKWAGVTTDEQIAAGNADFEALLRQLSGKTMEEYGRELAARKRRLKADIAATPERIDECKRGLTAEIDAAAKQAELDKAREEMRETEARIESLTARYEATAREQQERLAARMALESRRTAREFALRAEVERQEMAAKQAVEMARAAVRNAEQRNAADSRRCVELQRRMADLARQREQLLAEWRGIKAQQLAFEPGAFVCPTCGRPLEPDQIETKQAEMTARFNVNKAEQLADNQRRGLAVRQQMTDAQEELDRLTTDIDTRNRECAGAAPELAKTDEPKKTDYDRLFRADKEWMQLTEQIREANDHIAAGDDQRPDTTADKAAKTEIQARIESINAELYQAKINATTRERIADLEKQYKAGNEELARIEGTEYTMTAFRRARIEAVEERINAMFRTVTFRMYEQQINGGETETCEAMVGGVPYSSLNNAGQINAGLDIINAICQAEQITAPIFIDNAEAVITPTETSGQQVRLYVKDTDLIIK